MSGHADRYAALLAAVRALHVAQQKSSRAMAARMATTATTRARSTTTAARWATAAEHRDACEERVREELARLGMVTS